MNRSRLPLVVLLAVVASCSGSLEATGPARTQTTTQSATAPDLGTTYSFAVLGGSTVTNTGSSVVTGDLGVSPGAAVTGFPPGLVLGGTISAANAAAQQAQSDATIAWNALAGQACNVDLTGQDLGGKTLTAGTYCLSSSAQLTGTLTLNAEGDPAAVFVFQIGSTLTTASNASVVMINGGNSCNVFFQVGSSATLGTATQLTGNIFALTSITLNTGASLSGRAIARNGAVTLDTNSVSSAACQVGATVDAGTPVVDAGLPGVDAGTPVGVDAGSPVVDAGSEGDAGVCEEVDAGQPCGSQTDHDNCGTCGNVCGATEACVAGLCVCVGSP